VLVFVGYPMVFEPAHASEHYGKMARGSARGSDDGGPRSAYARPGFEVGVDRRVWGLLGARRSSQQLSPGQKRIGDILPARGLIMRARAESGLQPIMQKKLAWWGRGDALSA